jgi:isopentenyl-diphosphate delta-isomerase
VSEIEQRKFQHLQIATSPGAQGSGAGWDDVRLVPQAVPELDAADVDLTTRFLGAELRAPLVITGMTGGHEAAREVNARLGEAAERLGLAVGVGSQRAALVDPSLAPTFAAVRDRAPSALVLANLGAPQLIAQGATPPLDQAAVKAAIDMVGAQALAVHLNVLQEMVQTEGDRATAGFLHAIGGLVASSPVPVLAKEVGAGLSREAAVALAGTGVAALDVGGAGGTSFALVESIRAEQAGDRRGARLGRTFAGWGLPTAVSILESRAAGLPLVATGGVRTGLDAAKALALGADLVGIGQPAASAALRGVDDVVGELRLFLEELRLTLLLCGARSPAGLRRRQVVLTGPTRDWADQRGLGLPTSRRD